MINKNYPLVYAIVLNWNGFEDTVKCIDSLLNSNYSNLKIIIIDNASTDDSASLLTKKYPQLMIIKSKNNGGYASGMNLGTHEALKLGAEFLLYVNNDIIVTKDFLEPMIKIALANKKVGMISPKVLYQHDPNMIYCAGGELSKLRCVGLAKYQGKSADKYGTNSRNISIAEGCFIFIRKEVFENVGFMDEKFFMYFEDAEFSERVRDQFHILYLHNSIVYHKSGAGHSWSEYTDVYYFYYTRNRLLFFSEKSFFYKLYVITFSISNSIAKSLVLGSKLIVKNVNRKKIQKSIGYIWEGTFYGIRQILKLDSLEDLNQSRRI